MFKVGPTFGRKMMKGYLDMKAEHNFASEQQVKESLSRVAPQYHCGVFLFLGGSETRLRFMVAYR